MSAFFSSMETAFSAVNRIRLKYDALNGNKRAQRALKISENYDKTLTAILIGNNIVNILSASLGTIIFTELFGASGVGISTAVMTVLVLVFGEILPKTIAKENSEKIALAFADLLSFIIMILSPLVWFFVILKKGFSKLYKSDNSSPSVTEDELKYIIEEIEDEGVLEEQESDLVRSALEFDEITVEQILVPRVKVVAVEKDEDINKIQEIFLHERYSRMPVFDKSIDNIIGIVHEKDFFRLIMGDKVPSSIENIIQKAIYISETKLISEALREMQKAKIHMAIVKDQYGGTSGIVTMEDIIEELVGEIYDENDEVESHVIKSGENEYIISADLSISDMIEYLELPEDVIDSESNTVGGWVMELFDRIPNENDVAENGLFEITVLSVKHQHIDRIKMKVLSSGKTEIIQE
jgi:CBS domain containing-hemolysin-like protein